MSPLSPLQQVSRPRSRGRRRRTLIRRISMLAVLAAVVAAAVVVVPGLLSTDRHGARVLHYSIASRFVRGSLLQAAVIPAGSDGRGRPLLVFLHGKGSEGQDASLDSAMFAGLAAQGIRAPDIVFPKGGEDSYWHNRRSGAWASYVLDQVIPRALAITHADPRRIAIGGISMGGFGAYEIARLHRSRFCAVGGHSAALWPRAADTALGAFDDSQDFARHDLLRAARRGNPYGRTPLWLDAGSSDPFRVADAQFARLLARHGAAVQFSSPSGGHDSGYWDAHWGAYLRFYANALAGCGGP